MMRRAREEIGELRIELLHLHMDVDVLRAQLDHTRATMEQMATQIQIMNMGKIMNMGNIRPGPHPPMVRAVYPDDLVIEEETLD